MNRGPMEIAAVGRARARPHRRWVGRLMAAALLLAPAVGGGQTPVRPGTPATPGTAPGPGEKTGAEGTPARGVPPAAQAPVRVAGVGKTCGEHFARFDRNGDGRVTVEEFVQSPQVFAEPETLFQVRNRDQDTVLTEQEFCADWERGWGALFPGPPATYFLRGELPMGGDCLPHFQRFDGDENGRVTSAELARWPGVSREQMQVAGPEGPRDVSLSLREFCSIWRAVAEGAAGRGGGPGTGQGQETGQEKARRRARTRGRASVPRRPRAPAGPLAPSRRTADTGRAPPRRPCDCPEPRTTSLFPRAPMDVPSAFTCRQRRALGGREP